jgi:hypothetical protein
MFTKYIATEPVTTFPHFTQTNFDLRINSIEIPFFKNLAFSESLYCNQERGKRNFFISVNPKERERVFIVASLSLPLY